MRFLLARVAAAAAAAVVAVAAAAPVAQAEESARVVSVAVGSGKVSELVEAPADGTPFAPSWSHDGRHFAYSNTPCDGCAPEIRLVALGTRGARGPGGVVGNGSSPALSANGRSIVFVDLAGGLSVVTPSASRTRAILPPVPATILDAPHFSPDG